MNPVKDFVLVREQYDSQMKTIAQNEVKLRKFQKTYNDRNAVFAFMNVTVSIPIVGRLIDYVAYKFNVIPMRTLHQREIVEAIRSAKESNTSLTTFIATAAGY